MAPSPDRYSNPVIPEGINTTDQHPLKELIWLGGGLTVAAIALVLVFAWLGHIVGSFVSFETEQRIASGIADRFPSSDGEMRTAAYLQDLANRLTQADPLPEGMSISVHLADNDAVNAFATLGGHVVVTRGLLAAMPNENALAMVLAHEIAHVRERHVIRSLGRGVLTSLAIGLLSGASGNDLAGGLVGHAGITTALGFSRSQERAADRIALRNMHALYGHVAGASALFESLRMRDRHAAPEWLSTHPDHRNRIDALALQAEQAGWPTHGTLTPLPAGLASHCPASTSC